MRRALHFKSPLLSYSGAFCSIYLFTLKESHVIFLLSSGNSDPQCQPACRSSYLLDFRLHLQCLWVQKMPFLLDSFLWHNLHDHKPHLFLNCAHHLCSYQLDISALLCVGALCLLVGLWMPLLLRLGVWQVQKEKYGRQNNGWFDRPGRGGWSER